MIPNLHKTVLSISELDDLLFNLVFLISFLNLKIVLNLIVETSKVKNRIDYNSLPIPYWDRR